MAYIPPHKRLSKTQEVPAPTPVLPNFKKSLDLNLRSGSDKRADKNTSYLKRIAYADNSISRWLAIPPMDDVKLTSSTCLVPVSIDSPEFKLGEKLSTLVIGHSHQEQHEIERCDLENIWASVAETIHADLLSAFQNVRNVRNELVDQTLEETMTKIVARFGKVLFRRNPGHRFPIKEDSFSESYVKQLRRIFYTNISVEYIEHIKIAVIPELGVHFEEEKDIYRVKLADAKHPGSLISCKCKVRGEELELYKIESNPTRQLVVDISGLVSNVDLRLAMCTKRFLTALQDEEMQNIRDLISSAVFDSNVKGGLRWPLGKGKYGGQYSVVSVWHTKTEVYRSSSLKLKLREADRFDFLISMGEITREVVLELAQINKNLEQGSEAKGVLTMLEDALKLIRNHFLAWEGNLIPFSES